MPSIRATDRIRPMTPNVMDAAGQVAESFFLSALDCRALHILMMKYPAISTAHSARMAMDLGEP
jgi:hypothetical protein